VTGFVALVVATTSRTVTLEIDDDDLATVVFRTGLTRVVPGVFVGFLTGTFSGQPRLRGKEIDLWRLSDRWAVLAFTVATVLGQLPRQSWAALVGAARTRLPEGRLAAARAAFSAQPWTLSGTLDYNSAKAVCRLNNGQALSLVTRVHTSREAIGTKTCYFSAYSASGEVNSSVEAYLRDLKSSGFSVVFVTTAKTLTRRAEAILASLCHKVIIRTNFSLDFGSWALALRMVPIPANATSVLICNDSCAGPLVSIDHLLARMSFDEADMWGITDTPEVAEHLQSYFLLLSPQVFKSAAFDDFWQGFEYTADKWDLILKNEIGFSTRMRAAGFRLRALVPYDRLAALVRSAPRYVPEREVLARMGAVNPSLVLWRPAVEEYGLPFLKKELLMRDPFETLQWADLMALVGEKFSARSSLVADLLAEKDQQSGRPGAR
jgi:hypothetical protein